MEDLPKDVQLSIWQNLMSEADESQWQTVDSQSLSFVPLTMKVDEIVQMVRVRRSGNADYSHEFPLGKEISKKELCRVFDESDTKKIQVYFEYASVCDLFFEDSSFTPETEGEYTLVFDDDAIFSLSRKRTIAGLKHQDGLITDVKVHLTEELTALLTSKTDIDYVKNIFIKLRKWELMKKWAIEKGTEVMEAVIALVEEYTKDEGSFGNENNASTTKSAQSAKKLEKDAKEAQPIVEVPKTSVTLEQNTPQLTPREIFIENIEVGLRSTIEGLLDNKNWDVVSKIIDLKDDATKNAYKIYLESLKKDHSKEMAPEKVELKQLTPREAFLKCIDDGLKETIETFLDRKMWDSLASIVNLKDDATKNAFKVYFESYKSKHPEEFLQQVSTYAERKQDEEIKQEEDEEPEKTTDRKLFNFEEPLTIVFLGETGVGKSTFINAFANYMIHKNMYDARDNNPVILIPVEFEHQDDDLNPIPIKCEPTIKMEEEDKSNEILEAGQSCTQHAKTYLFHVGPGEHQVVRIIDTPGVHDVRGREVEAKNFDSTLRYLSKYPKIDAILILLKPNEPVLSLSFKYCLKELLTHLHSSASKNILFCFTNTQSTQYSPGDTLPVLRKFLDELQRTRNITIPILNETIFCFDNEAFRFLCAWINGIHFEQAHIESFNKSWTTSARETFRLLSKIKQLPPHLTRDTLSINNIRNVVFTFARPLVKIKAALQTNIGLIEDEENKIASLEGTQLHLINEPIQLELVVPHAKELDMPVTVCTNEATCIEIKSYTTANQTKIAITNYVTRCHNPCYLTGVAVELVPNEQIKHCAAFSKYGINKCSNCSCPWNTHMHVRHILVEEVRKMDNEKLKKDLETCTNDLQKQKVTLENLRKMKVERENEIKKINSACAEFVAYLRKNACAPYNDVYREYAIQLIKEERKKVSMGAPDRALRQMEKDLAEHDEQVYLLENLPEGTGMKSIEEIEDLLKDIKNLPHCKKMLEDVEKLEWLSIQAEQNNRETNVSLKNGWAYNRYNK